MLAIEELDLFYGDAQALAGVSLTVAEGTIVTLVGANGAGKTSLIRAVAGMHRPRRGRIMFRGRDIAGWPSHRVCNLGIGQVAEGRQIFPALSVLENLKMGAMLPRAWAKRAANLDRVAAMFPLLVERFDQPAGTLSGGEQQMLAIGRALMARPRMILLDEPSMGLSPLLVEQIFEIIQRLNREQGLTILVVEQDVRLALRISSYAYILENGELNLHGPSKQLLNDPAVRRAYLGV